MKATFSISPKGIKYAYKLLSNNVPPGFLIQFRSADYEVNYRYYNKKWHLDNTKGEVERYAVNLATQDYTIFSSVSELVVTAKKSNTNYKIKRSEAFKPNDALVDVIKDYDAVFWKNYQFK